MVKPLWKFKLAHHRRDILDQDFVLYRPLARRKISLTAKQASPGVARRFRPILDDIVQNSIVHPQTGDQL